MKKVKKFICTVLVLLTVTIIVTDTFQVPVQAAKTVSAKKIEHFRKCPNIKKKGNYKVVCKCKTNMIRFTAPKNRTYTFTFYNFRNLNKKLSDNEDYGHVMLQKMDKQGFYFWQAKTNGGKWFSLHMASKKVYNKYFRGKKVTKDSYLCSRYAKVKLRKGETLYIDSDWTTSKYQYTMKIK